MLRWDRDVLAADSQIGRLICESAARKNHREFSYLGIMKKVIAFLCLAIACVSAEGANHHRRLSERRSTHSKSATASKNLRRTGSFSRAVLLLPNGRMCRIIFPVILFLTAALVVLLCPI
jgi:hypothetical protein